MILNKEIDLINQLKKEKEDIVKEIEGNKTETFDERIRIRRAIEQQPKITSKIQKQLNIGE